jgi:acyl-coenzyme A synthetase/AMP-(fatty) acid ligase
LPGIFFGCIHAGVVPVLVSTSYNSTDFQYLVDLIDPCGIIYEPSVELALQQVCNNFKIKYSLSYIDTILNRTEFPIPSAHMQYPDSLAYITMTSGTTSRAKAVMNSHARFRNYIKYEGHPYYNLTADSVCMITTKFYFAWGLCVGIICPLAVGAKVVITSKFSARSISIQLIKHQATCLFIVPTVARLLTSYTKNKNISFPLQLFMGGEMPSLELINLIKEVFKNTPLTSIGMTETGGYCGITRDNNTLTLGNFLFGGKIKILNENGNKCSNGEIGEIYVASKNPTMGYWQAHEATQETYISGWIRTKDLGHFDDQHNLIVKGRVGDMFKINGITHYAGDIEQQVLTNSEVTECVVITEPNPEKLQMHSVSIYVVSKLQSDKVKEKILSAVIGINLKTSQIKFVDAIPKSSTQKKAKYKLLKKD